VSDPRVATVTSASPPGQHDGRAGRLARRPGRPAGCTHVKRFERTLTAQGAIVAVSVTVQVAYKSASTGGTPAPEIVEAVTGALSALTTFVAALDTDDLAGQDTSR